jgi:hypothetical protein
MKSGAVHAAEANRRGKPLSVIDGLLAAAPRFTAI